MNASSSERPTNRYLRILREDAAAAAATLRLGAGAPVPTCPGWLVADVAIHLGAVHRQWAFMLQHPEADYSTVRRELLRETLPGGLAWFERSERGSTETRGIPPNLVEWFEEAAGQLVQAYAQADPSAPLRLRGIEQPLEIPGLLLGLATETAVHRWDMQHAHSCDRSVDRQLAEESIPRMFDHVIPGHRAWAMEHGGTPRQGRGEAYLFEQVDGPGRWFVQWEGNTANLTSEAREEPHVTVRGTASDLYLFLWHRLPVDRVVVSGDAALLERYFDLASL